MSNKGIRVSRVQAVEGQPKMRLSRSKKRPGPYTVRDGISAGLSKRATVV